jgi:DNA polymerase-1
MVDPQSDEKWKIWRAERQLFNSLIQGSLGDIIKLAMIRLHNMLKEDAELNPGKEIKLILSVHDELVLLCPEDRVNVGSALLREAMLGDEIQDLIRVPLDVGKVAVVDRWSEAKE